MSKRVLAVLMVSLFLAFPASAKRKVQDYTDTIENFRKIPAVANFFDSAHGYAVFRTIGKGGLGIGGSHGKGQVYRGGDVVGFTSISDISIGIQAGGQAYSQIIFFEDEEALIRFTSGDFEFGASAEAIAIQAKAEAKASTEQTSASASESKTAKKATTSTEYKNGMVIFTMAKGGLMFAATVAGQKYTYKAAQ